MSLSAHSHFIFDFDETIVTLLIDWSGWPPGVLALFLKYEPNFDPSTRFNMSAIHRFIERYGEAFRTEFVAFEQQLEINNYQGYEIVPAGFQLLQQAHQADKNLYLLTSNCRAVVLPVLSELGIADYFDKIITVDDVPNLKPSPAPWPLITGGKAVDKSQYLMVGDSESDSGFAAAVGIDFVNVRELNQSSRSS